MGYRTYVGEIPKRQYNKIKRLSVDELFTFYNKNRYDEDGDDDDYISVYDFGQMVYEFGKYTDFEPPKKSIKNFFTNKETQKHFEGDNEINIVTKEFLEYIIMYYSEKVRTYYREMLKPFYNEKGREDSDILKSVKRDYGANKTLYSADFDKATIEEQTALIEMIHHVRSMALEWGVSGWFEDSLPFRLESGESVTNSCKYEYAVFRLVQIYKTFDWKRNHLYYYGY